MGHLGERRPVVSGVVRSGCTLYRDDLLDMKSWSSIIYHSLYTDVLRLDVRAQVRTILLRDNDGLDHFRPSTQPHRQLVLRQYLVLHLDELINVPVAPRQGQLRTQLNR